MINQSKIILYHPQQKFTLFLFFLRWKIRILGDMLVSFPAAILSLIVNPSPILNMLEFRLQNLDKVENIIANPQLITA